MSVNEDVGTGRGMDCEICKSLSSGLPFNVFKTRLLKRSFSNISFYSYNLFIVFFFRFCAYWKLLKVLLLLLFCLSCFFRKGKTAKSQPRFLSLSLPAHTFYTLHVFSSWAGLSLLSFSQDGLGP